jgi:TonB family protein
MNRIKRSLRSGWKFFCPLIILFLLFSPSLSAQYGGVLTDPDTGKKGYVNPLKADTLIPFIYNDLRAWAGDTLLTAVLDGRKGIVSKTHQLVVPIEFEEINRSVPVGRNLGYVGVQQNGLLGLYDYRSGKEVLPPKFDFVRGLQSNIVVGRRPDADQLEFYDQKGKRLFKAKGQEALSGFNAETVEIYRANETSYFLNLQGEDPFHGKFPDGRWTDGNLVICATINYRRPDWVGLLNVDGDTILPCIYRSIEPIDEDRFLVSSRDRKFGLINGRGEFVIPLSRGELSPITDQPGSALVLKSRGNYTQEVYDASGNLLLSNCRVGRPDGSLYVRGKTPDQYPDRYFIAYQKEEESTGLFHADGRVILPMEYNRIKYVSDQHPLVVYKEGVYSILNWEGQAAIPMRFRQLDYTVDPNLFYGMPEDGDKSGFIQLDRPDQNQFLFDRLQPLSRTGFYAVREAGAYYLHDPAGKRLQKQGFAFMGTPGKEQYVAWRAKGLSTSMIAVGRRFPEAEGTLWVGLDEKGDIYELRPSELQLLPQEEEEVLVDEEVEERPVQKEKKVKATPEEEKIYDRPQKAPAFPGGESEMLAFIEQNLQYPEEAKANQLSGMVVVSFVIEKDGAVSNLRVTREIGGGCGEEAMRVIRSMPKWSPGKQDGKPVRSLKVVPVRFVL